MSYFYQETFAPVVTYEQKISSRYLGRRTINTFSYRADQACISHQGIPLIQYTVQLMQACMLPGDTRHR